MLHSDPCAPCGLCCRSYLVPLFGHDVVRIITEQQRAPESFIFIAEQEKTDALGFRLDASPTTFGLALLKSEPITLDAPCIFLQQEGPTSRCTIYHSRPATCRAYPMAKLGQSIYQRANTLCPPNSWPAEDLAAAHRWRSALQTLRMHRDIYVEATARWNAALSKWSPPAQLPVRLFTEYLLASYRPILELEHATNPESLAEIVDTWASLPPQSDSETSTVPREEEPAWLRHFRRVRDLIDRTFPELPPLPFQRLVIESESHGST